MEIYTKELPVVNKYRCETCTNKEPVPTPRWASETPLRLGERCKITKQKCKKKFTSGVGCASHSELQKVQEDKLDRFVDWCSSFDDYTCGSVFTPSFVLKKLASIRKEGKAGE